jgi:uncharacterized protein (DUF2336 family)
MANLMELPPSAILRALDDPQWTTRAKGVERMAFLYCAGQLDRAAKRAAEDAFRRLHYDGDAEICRLLAECLKDAEHLPPELALAIATDRAAVAADFIERSPALSDADQLAILRDFPGPHRLALARRRTLSEQVREALRRCGDPAVAAAIRAGEANRSGAAGIPGARQPAPGSQGKTAGALAH